MSAHSTQTLVRVGQTLMILLLGSVTRLAAQVTDSIPGAAVPQAALGISVGTESMNGGGLVGFKVTPVTPGKAGVDFGVSFYTDGGTERLRYPLINLGVGFPLDVAPVTVVLRGGIGTFGAIPFMTYTAVTGVLPVNKGENLLVRVDLMRRSWWGSDAVTGVEFGFAWLRP